MAFWIATHKAKTLNANGAIVESIELVNSETLTRWYLRKSFIDSSNINYPTMLTGNNTHEYADTQYTGNTAIDVMLVLLANLDIVCINMKKLEISMLIESWKTADSE